MPRLVERLNLRRTLTRRSLLNTLVILLLIVFTVLCRHLAYGGEPETVQAPSQGLWISNLVGDENGFVSELVHAQLLHSGMPQVALKTGDSQDGILGKLAFDGAGDLWIPFCGNGPPNNGLVAEYSPAALKGIAARNLHGVKTKARLTGSDFHCPRALVFDRGGNLWIANAGIFDGNAESIVEYTAASLSQTNPVPSVVLTSSSFGALRGLAFDAAGDLWVTDNSTNAVYEFTPARLSNGGSQTPDLILQSSSFEFPADIAFDAANNIWVAYQEGNQRPHPGPGAVQMFAAASLTGSGTIQPRVALEPLSRLDALLAPADARRYLDPERGEEPAQARRA
jgi:streptogramin lyase